MKQRLGIYLNSPHDVFCWGWLLAWWMGEVRRLQTQGGLPLVRCYFLLVRSSLAGVSSPISVSLCSKSTKSPHSRRPSLSFSLTYSFQQGNTHIEPCRHTCTPGSLLPPSNLGSLSVPAYLIGRIFFLRFCSLKHWRMSHSAATPKDKHAPLSFASHQSKASSLHQMSF